MHTDGAVYAWEFEKGERKLKVRVDGQIVGNTIRQRLDAALPQLSRRTWSGCLFLSTRAT